MKKITLVFALTTLFLGFNACKKNDTKTTTTTTTSTTTTVTKVPLLNQLLIDTEMFDVGMLSQPQSGGDHSFYAVWADTAHTIDLRFLFNPLPDSSKTYTVSASAPAANSGFTQLTLTYDASTQAKVYNAVTGGTVQVTAVNQGTGNDSTYIKFTNVTFKKQGYPNKVLSGYVGTAN